LFPFYFIILPLNYSFPSDKLVDRVIFRIIK
jgi:hypothetical protein